MRCGRVVTPGYRDWWVSGFGWVVRLTWWRSWSPWVYRPRRRYPPTNYRGWDLDWWRE